MNARYNNNRANCCQEFMKKKTDKIYFSQELFSSPAPWLAVLMRFHLDA
jgi:hypothetical protein